MMEAWMNTISPYVRFVKIVKSPSLSGEWIDFDHVFTYIEQGEAEFILNGVRYAAREGDLFLMPPMLPHIIRTTSEVPLIQYIIHFDLYYDDMRSGWKETGLIDEQTRQIPEREQALADVFPVAHLRTSDRMEVKKRFLLMQKVFLDEMQNRDLRTKAIATELLYFFHKGQVDRNEQEGKLTKGWGVLEKAISYIHAHYADAGLDNTTISQHAGVSTNHLSFLFKEQLQITIQKYVTHVRIEQAKAKMMDGHKTMTVVAEEVGFSSIHLFSRSFKATVGITPSQFFAANSAIRKEG
ncbi:AraC family transcriptional regulator [Paenibacillus sp. JCM 10914]|uniref:helix-turn-helix transcriptional regulator n=1 Tax=Paenibacillus sp. JCM 10914 TaxID=1236974 RepID=UPI0003CC2B25|nr:AraC family transcriptional regulator [Paenibacillus sp. JCM 10914]GAE05676.1 two-component response regulator yesN, associated with MetSO reductase [Paenibacillus sp. JCM 10914]